MLIQIRKVEYMNIKDERNLERYEALINEFLELESLAKSSDSPELDCKISLKKLRLAREFTKIDESILEVSLKQSSSDSAFFSEILFLEAKRLRFKEEAIKCIQTRTKSKIST